MKTTKRNLLENSKQAMFSPLHRFEIFIKMFYNLMLLLLAYMLIWSKFATQNLDPGKLTGQKLIHFVSLKDIFSESMNIAQYCFGYFFNYNKLCISTVFLFGSNKSRFHVALYLLGHCANDPFYVMKVLPSEQILNTLYIHIFSTHWTGWKMWINSIRM